MSVRGANFVHAEAGQPVAPRDAQPVLYWLRVEGGQLPQRAGEPQRRRAEGQLAPCWWSLQRVALRGAHAHAREECKALRVQFGLHALVGGGLRVRAGAWGRFGARVRVRAKVRAKVRHSIR
jgi:hypothetical protein